MTGNFSTDLIVVYIPLLLAAVMGILGALRGARREAVVSGSIVLAALIIIVWGVPWATDLSNIFTNFSVADSRNVLSYIVMALTVLVTGYLLGSALVPRTPTNPISRLGGLLLGIFNGLAIGGYLIRGQYESALLGGSSSSADVASVLTTNSIARYLWIGANWFPLAVAVIAAVVAIVGPFRRSQAAVATPAARTDWGPSTAPAATIAAPGPAAYTTGYGQQGYTTQYPQQPAQPQYGQQTQSQTQAQSPSQAQGQYGQQYHQQYGAAQPTQAHQYVPSSAAQQQQYGQYNPPSYTPPAPTPAPATPVYTPPTSYSPAPAAPSANDDAPATTLMSNAGTSSGTSSTSSGGQSTLYIGNSDTKSNKDTDPQLKAPEWPGYTSEPSWLSPAASDSSGSSSSTSSSGASAPTPPALADNSIIARSQAPTEAQPLVTPSTVSNAESSSPLTLASSTSYANPPIADTTSDTSADATTSFVNCPRCGTLVASDATFCTECGNRMKS